MQPSNPLCRRAPNSAGKKIMNNTERQPLQYGTDYRSDNLCGQLYMNVRFSPPTSMSYKVMRGRYLERADFHGASEPESCTLGGVAPRGRTCKQMLPVSWGPRVKWIILPQELLIGNAATRWTTSSQVRKTLKGLKSDTLSHLERPED